MILEIFIAALLHQYIQCEQYVVNLRKNVNATEAFIFKFDATLYDWTEDDVKYGIKYYIVVNNSYELPPWMGIRNELEENSFYVFGSTPVSVSFIMLEVTALNLQTYEPRLCVLNLTVNTKNETDYAKYAVQILVNNVNLNDFYNKTRLKDFKDIFDDTFWKDSKNKSYITLFQTAELIPGRRYPLNPTDKEGVLVHIGSPNNYSYELLRLEREVRPSTKNICPGYIKRMSVERFVRPKHFIFNWCYFHLVNPTTTLLGSIDKQSYEFEEIPANATSILERNIVKLPKRDDIFSAGVSAVTFMMLWPSLVLIVLLLTWLSFIFCISGDKFFRIRVNFSKRISYGPFTRWYNDRTFAVCSYVNVAVIIRATVIVVDNSLFVFRVV